MKKTLIILTFFLISVTVFSQEKKDIKKEIKNEIVQKININPSEVSEKEPPAVTGESFFSKEKIIDFAPFTKNFIWQEKSPDPYNHYLAVAFTALDVRDNKYPFYWFNMQYGQHANLFRLPGRFSFNLGLFGGRTLLGDRQTYGDILSFYLGVMYEFIFTFKYFYITTGVGIYIRDNKDHKIGSNFVFGPKIAIGKTINNMVDIELVYQHFSNGYLESPNRGINLLALQIGIRI